MLMRPRKQKNDSYFQKINSHPRKGMFRGVLFVGLLFGMILQPSFVQAEVGKVVTLQGKVLVRNQNSSDPLKPLKLGDSVTEGSMINTSSDGSVKLLMRDKTLLDLGPSTLFKIDEYQINTQAKDRQADVSIDYGKMRALVSKKMGNKSKFKVRTRSATMGVRGTEFVVLSNLDSPPNAPQSKGSGQNRISKQGVTSSDQAPAREQTEIIVKEGRVDVQSSGSNAKPVALTKGTRAKLTAPQINPVGSPLTQQGTSRRKLASSPDAPPQIQVEKISVTEANREVSAIKVQDQTFRQMVVIKEATDGNQSSGSETLRQAFQGMDQIEIKLPEPEDFQCAGCPTEFEGLNEFRPQFQDFVQTTVRFQH